MVLYVIGSGIYILSLMAANRRLEETSQCLNIDTSSGMILEKDNARWNNLYTIVQPTTGSVELKCPTSRPTIYMMVNHVLIGHMDFEPMPTNHLANITGCNHMIQYNMRVGESFPILINHTLLMVSGVIWQNTRVIYYVKQGVYGTYDIDVYNDRNLVVANIRYTDRWMLDTYDQVDHLLLLSLVGYHQIYMNGFEPDRCNEFVMITSIAIGCIFVALCCGCCFGISAMYRRVEPAISRRLNE